MRTLSILLILLSAQLIFGLELCPAGQFYDETAESCKSCGRGTYADGTIPLSECKPCPAATFSKSKAAECTPCPAGSVSATPLSDSCSVCRSGTYEVNRMTCEKCPAGTSSASDGATKESDCVSCEPGYYTPSSGRSCGKCPAKTFEVNRTSCQECPPGSTSVAGAKECTFCPAGSIIDGGFCKKCTAGTYEVDNRTSCAKCPKGTFSLDEAKECTPCKPGHFAPMEGQKQCGKCPSGQFEVNRTSCSLCIPGTFSAEAGAASGSCFPCEAGKAAGSSGLSSCDDCGAGTFYKNSTTCEKCPAGTSGKDGTCSKCPRGRVTLSKGELDCVSCPAGTFEVDSKQCEDCASGMMSTVGSTSCQKCPKGSIYVNATYCQATTDIKKEGEQEGQEGKGNNNVVMYVLGAGLVAVLFFVVIYKCNSKSTPDYQAFQDEGGQNEMKSIEVHHKIKENPEKFVIRKTVM